jgi:hypothetical protein
LPIGSSRAGFLICQLRTLTDSARATQCSVCYFLYFVFITFITSKTSDVGEIQKSDILKSKSSQKPNDNEEQMHQVNKYKK